MHLEQCVRQRIVKAFQLAFITQTFSKSFDDFYVFKIHYIYTVSPTQFHSSLPTLYKSNDLILLRFLPKPYLPFSPSPYNPLMRISTRHSSLSLCDLDLNILKVMSILKENLNNNAADGMIIQKQVKSVSYLQLVSSNALWLKKITKMVRWTAYNSLWLMWHEQIKELNMKMKTDKGSSLLVKKNLSPEARKVLTEIDELKSEEKLTTELSNLWYLKNSAK